MNWDRRRKKQIAREEWKAKLAKGHKLICEVFKLTKEILEFDDYEAREIDDQLYYRHAGIRIGKVCFKKRRVR